jgi:hypothetical protein
MSRIYWQAWLLCSLMGQVTEYSPARPILKELALAPPYRNFVWVQYGNTLIDKNIIPVTTLFA